MSLSWTPCSFRVLGDLGQEDLGAEREKSVYFHQEGVCFVCLWGEVRSAHYIEVSGILPGTLVSSKPSVCSRIICPQPSPHNPHHPQQDVFK